VLGAPLVWLGVVYVGSLAALLVTSLWVQDSFTSEVFRTWTLATLREKLINIGAKVIRHARAVTFQMAGVAVPRALFTAILRATALYMQ